MHEFSHTRRIQFAETDMAGIAHFSSFFRYMEEVEHAFFRSIGFSIVTKLDRHFGWPRVHASCDYKQPLRFEDEVQIQLLVREKKEKSITYEFTFRKLDADGVPGDVCAVGRLVTVCVVMNDDGGIQSVAIPAEIAKAIDEAPE